MDFSRPKELPNDPETDAESGAESCAESGTDSANDEAEPRWSSWTSADISCQREGRARKIECVHRQRLRAR